MLPTDEQVMIRDMARDFAHNELTPKAAEWEKKGAFAPGVLEAMGELGLMGAYPIGPLLPAFTFWNSTELPLFIPFNVKIHPFPFGSPIQEPLNRLPENPTAKPSVYSSDKSVTLFPGAVVGQPVVQLLEKVW